MFRIKMLKATHTQNVEKFNFEIDFLKSDKATSCPYFPRLIAHARDDDSEFLGVVYDLQSSNTLCHFVDKAEFKWLERIKVAVGLARLLRHLHDQPMYLVRDLAASHIMLDKDWKPVLFNYFLVLDGPMDVKDREDTRFSYGSWAYIDPVFICSGHIREYSDVYAFGVILCELLFKCKVDEYHVNGKRRFVHYHAAKLYPMEYRRKVSFVKKLFRLKSGRKVKAYFVDKSLEEDPYFSVDDGLEICVLARLCVDSGTDNRPNMNDSVKLLEKLHVVRDNADIFTT